MLRPLNVNLFDLEVAMFEFTSSDEFRMQGYLDQQTGEVIVLGGDVSFDISNPGDKPPKNLSGWQLKEWERCRKVMSDSTGRHIEIPPDESVDSWQLRADFADQLTDDDLRDRLSSALRGSGAFRRFKDELHPHPDALKAWYEYEANAQRQTAKEWLESIGIQSTWTPPKPA